MANPTIGLLRRRVPRAPKAPVSPISHPFNLHPLRSHSALHPAASFSETSPSTKTSLSARMSFVFDQIDAIEKNRFRRDEAFERIRAWRESRNRNRFSKYQCHPASDSGIVDVTDSEKKTEKDGLLGKQVELVHPWREWIELMEKLIQLKYFDTQGKKDGKVKDGMVPDAGFDTAEVAKEVNDFTRDYTTVRKALEKFGKDRFDIIRSVSRQDIRILVGNGCPCSDGGVVSSAKVLRKYVRVVEGDVCCSCSLRGSCKNAFLLKDDNYIAKTRDLLRVLLAFAFEPVNGSVENKPLLKLKSVKTVARKLLYQVVKLSEVPINPKLSPPVLEVPPKVKKRAQQAPKKLREEEMKQGDWQCPVCKFMNFAKNKECLECDAKKPRREMLPGEWICPGCDFLNFRQNKVCHQCQRRRPPDDYTEKLLQLEQERKQTEHARRLERFAKVSKAWNFDFDDMEVDGADIASFEQAGDSPVQGGRRSPRPSGRDFPSPDHNKRGLGFDDFGDEHEFEISEEFGDKKAAISGGGDDFDVDDTDDSEEDDGHDSIARVGQAGGPYRDVDLGSGEEFNLRSDQGDVDGSCFSHDRFGNTGPGWKENSGLALAHGRTFGNEGKHRGDKYGGRRIHGNMGRNGGGGDRPQGHVFDWGTDR